MPHGKWTFRWELRGLDKRIIARNEGALDFSTVSNKNLSLIKRNAIVIKDLDIGRYRLLISFKDGEGRKIENLPYPITIRNEVDNKSNITNIIVNITFSVPMKAVMSDRRESNI